MNISLVIASAKPYVWCKTYVCTISKLMLRLDIKLFAWYRATFHRLSVGAYKVIKICQANFYSCFLSKGSIHKQISTFKIPKWYFRHHPHVRFFFRKTQNYFLSFFVLFYWTNLAWLRLKRRKNKKTKNLQKIAHVDSALNCIFRHLKSRIFLHNRWRILTFKNSKMALNAKRHFKWQKITVESAIICLWNGPLVRLKNISKALFRLWTFHPKLQKNFGYINHYFYFALAV